MSNSDKKTPFFQRLPLVWRMIFSYSLLVCLLLLLILGYLLFYQLKDKNKQLEAQICQLSSALAENEAIMKGLESNELDETTVSMLDALHRNLTNVDYIVIVNNDDIRIYHPEKDLIGHLFEGGDEGPALSGRSPSYITHGKGSRLYQLRAFTTVYNTDGGPVGFIMVSTYMSRIHNLNSAMTRQFGLLFTAALILGILFAILIARSIRRSLLGFEPKQLRELYIQKSDLLNALDEGIIAIDSAGQCIDYNQAALTLFHSPETISDFSRRELQGTYGFNNRRIRFGSTDLLVSLLKIQDKNQPLGAMAILRDRTEVNELAEELTGVQHIIAALRATTHEHKNKLHVIMGLLQIGDTQAAMNYISTTNNYNDQSITRIYDRIENRTIAALLCGKQNRARELDIAFTLQNDSHLDSHNDFLSVGDMVTIIGNLIENAFDALKDYDGIRKVSVFIQNTSEGITIIVDDTGPGMPEEYIDKIFNSSFTTKGEGHGIGLSLIKNILNQNNGLLDIASAPGEGSSFTISINQKRLRKEERE